MKLKLHCIFTFYFLIQVFILSQLLWYYSHLLSLETRERRSVCLGPRTSKINLTRAQRHSKPSTVAYYFYFYFI